MSTRAVIAAMDTAKKTSIFLFKRNLSFNNIKCCVFDAVDPAGQGHKSRFYS